MERKCARHSSHRAFNHLPDVSLLGLMQLSAKLIDLSAKLIHSDNPMPSTGPLPLTWPLVPIQILLQPLQGAAPAGKKTRCHPLFHALFPSWKSSCWTGSLIKDFCVESNCQRQPIATRRLFIIFPSFPESVLLDKIFQSVQFVFWRSRHDSCAAIVKVR